MWAFIILLCAAIAAPALGKPRRGREFKRHYEQALQLYEQSRFEESIREFEAAYAIQQLPHLLYNIGRAHFQLGHANEALDAYTQFLKLEPEPPEDIKARVTEHMEKARAMLDAAARLHQTEPPPDEKEPLEPRTPQPADAPQPPVKEPPAQAAAPVNPSPLAAQVVASEPAPAPLRPPPRLLPRPLWRIVTSTIAMTAGLTLAGLGAGAAAIDGTCSVDPVPPVLECERIFRSLMPGAVMLSVGLVLAGGGAVLLIWPGRGERKRAYAPATYDNRAF